MKRENNFIFSISILISFLFCLVCFTGCNRRAEQKSLTDQFITIDALIQQNQMSSAVKELKKAEKRVYDEWSYLGLYKRYYQIGEHELAEKVILKALKSYPKNINLNAVYTNFLINQGRIEEALDYGKKLANTEYASLYSEAILRNVADDKNADFNFYTDKDFYKVFYDAYVTSKNPIWIRNCGIFDLILGNYERIGSLAPSAYSDATDAYFWGLALYDAGKYYECIEAIDSAQSFLNGTNAQLTALMSDAYMCLSDMDMAEKARQELIFNISKGNQGEATGINLTDPLMPVIMTNSAIWAYNQGFNDECADLLFFIVNHWPDYIPGIVLYCNFAYNSNLQRDENPEIQSLREAGIATIEMEQYDNRRKIPLSDAMHRVDEALKRTSNPYLNIVQLDLKYKMDKTLTEKDKNRDLWNMLENGYFNGDDYKNLLVQYALNSLLRTKEYEDGWNLFKHYVLSVSDYHKDRDFWEQFIENVRNYDIGIVEFGAWFAAYGKLRNEAIRLLEYCVYESGGLLEDGYISQKVSTATCMNLGDVYFSIGKSDKALDLYGRIGGRESKKSLRSEIFYRIASIYAFEGDIKNALRSAEYACTLYPDNVRASLLKDKLLFD